MNSFQFFDASDYGIVLLMLLFSSYLLIQLLKKTKQQIADKQIDSVRRKGLFWFVIGDFCIVVSVIGFILLEKDYQRVIGLFRPILIMTSEPIVFLMSAIFLAGIVLSVTGIYSLRSGFQKKT